VRWLWRLHRVHHSDPTLTVTTALRFHPGEILLSLPLRMAAVAALGAPVVGIVAFEVVFALANLIEHGDVALPPRLERRLAGAVVTPAIHRRHHDERVANRERNFATVFTWWDRCFGTFGASDARDRWAIGTPELAVPTTLGAALALPFVRR
jgi:sterol desaturase/sphingolipid hydroxylase (fatty acid hydroxylase superfamily)